MALGPDEVLKDEKNPRTLDEHDIALLMTYMRCLIFHTKTLIFRFPLHTKTLILFITDWFLVLSLRMLVNSVDGSVS